jgi:hypothetical protein
MREFALETACGGRGDDALRACGAMTMAQDRKMLSPEQRD